MVEHLTRNEKVVSSILTTSSKGKNHCLFKQWFFVLNLRIYLKFDFNIVYAERSRARYAAGLHIAAARAAL